MTKQLLVLAFAAAFGIAHATDIKPAALDAKAAAAPVAATVKAEAPKAMDAVKTTEAKPAAADSTVAPAAAPQVKKEAAKPAGKKAKKMKKVTKPVAAKAAPDAASVEAAKTVESAKK